MSKKSRVRQARRDRRKAKQFGYAREPRTQHRAAHGASGTSWCSGQLHGTVREAEIVNTPKPSVTLMTSLMELCPRLLKVYK